MATPMATARWWLSSASWQHTARRSKPSMRAPFIPTRSTICPCSSGSRPAAAGRSLPTAIVNCGRWRASGDGNCSNCSRPTRASAKRWRTALEHEAAPMIHRLVRRVQSLLSRSPRLRKTPRRIPATQHGIDREKVPRSALRTCETLQAAGHRAYLVGGAVRDLLLGIEPKDFDVATDATPEQVKSHFRRAIIIGRRFRLVHVMFGSEAIEVSTFRAYDIGSGDTDEHGRVLADNVSGEQYEDAARRDFTINALYYDPSTGEVLDYHDGVRDIRKRRLRMMGAPETRYREDPVRMLRAVRFAAKLGFEIDAATRAPIARLASLIENVPAARLFDEMLKLLTSGYSVTCISQLRAEGLHHPPLPHLYAI